ncbi:MGT1 [Candida jiufengensis]|uniref:MGT1 n=1 Tax=Candida jiufengensis TaxID=497108 RepID=UPI002224EF06|nr:MGT1 [Candida jiufengensis]KAI5955046.1 MGT1 [Candida jiufengensis]
MKQQVLYYKIVENKPFNALLVLDEIGKIYYASIGKNSNAFREQLVNDFKPLKDYQLRPVSTLNHNSAIEEEILKFMKVLKDPSTSQEFEIEFIFGTNLQRKVWNKLLEIPKGQVKTYGDIANELGMKVGSSRAIGNCIGANRIAIIIPCHRVLGFNKKINGYRFGVDAKEYLLKHELGNSYDEFVK